MRTFSQMTLTITQEDSNERTGKNCQTIAVTLRLRFAARVKYYGTVLEHIIIYLAVDVAAPLILQLPVKAQSPRWL